MAAVASSGVGLSLAARESAAAQSSPAPAPTKTEKPPTASAAALAVAMRQFDPGLTDGDLQTIAKAIDANNDAAKALNPKKHRLPNDLGPVAVFVVHNGAA